MRKIHIIVLFILVTNNIFCQNFGINITDINNDQDLNFRSVEKSMKLIKLNEINNYKIIDTINKLENLLNDKVKIISIVIKKPKAYLIQNFENKTGTISIAIKDNEEFKVYEIFSGNFNTNDDTLSLKRDDNKLDFNSLIQPNFKIKELKRVKLDKFKSEELLIRFSYQTVGCPNCNQTQASTKNGYIIFDFDKLQLLKLINFSASSLKQQLKDLENAEFFKIEFNDNYVRMKKRKYFYEDNKLIRK